MTKWFIRIFGGIVIIALVVVVVATTHAQSSQERLSQHSYGMPEVAANTMMSTCSTVTIAGAWVFATDLGPIQGGGYVTALGTLNFDTHGNMSGKYDFNVPGFPGNWSGVQAGKVNVNPNCTGIMTFTWTDSTGEGTRTDSLVIARGGREIWGMVADGSAVWTYKAERINEAP